MRLCDATKKISFFLFNSFGMCIVRGIMHYKIFLEVMKVVHGIPMEDLNIIMNKPKSYDRKADLIWRKACERNGIDTSPMGVKTSDPVAYSKHASAAQNWEKAQQRINDLEEELRKTKTQLALVKVLNR